MGLHHVTMSESTRQGPWSGRLGRWLMRGLTGIGLIALGAVGAVLVLESDRIRPRIPARMSSTHSAVEEAAMTAPTAIDPADDVEVVLSPEAVAQAGIKTAEVTVVERSTSVQVSGTIMANAYREVKVFPIVGGIITKLHAELGTAVKRGAPLATIFSAELAEAQTKYLSAKAMVEADRQKLERTKQLIAIGAASR